MPESPRPDLPDRTIPESVLEPIRLYGDARAWQQADADAVIVDELARKRDSAVADLEAMRVLSEAQTASFDALQAEFDTYRASHTKPDVTVLELVDFTQSSMGLVLEDKPVPNGANVIRMRPWSSTKASAANALVKPQTNPHRLMQVGSSNPTSSPTYNGLDVGWFILEATDQGHSYGGLRLGYSTRAHLHDITVKGIPGFDSSPPGETFALALYHPDSATLDRVTVDGRDAAGNPVTGTAIGYNYVTGTTVASYVVANWAKYGFAVALWQCSGTQIFNNCDFRYCRKGINIEQSVGGTYEFNACDFRGLTGATFAAQVSSIQKSSRGTVRDPVVDTLPFKVRTYGSTALSGANVQADADITCYMNGVDVTRDTTKFQIVRTG
jgi:hypothetical protein